MDDKVNLAQKFALLVRPYEPGIVGYLNDYKLQIVKIQGSFVWHKHDETDDFFLVMQGRLTIQRAIATWSSGRASSSSCPAGSSTAQPPTRRPWCCSSSRATPPTPAMPAAS